MNIFTRSVALTTALILAFFLEGSLLHAQWNELPDFPAGATDGSVSFVIDGVAYVTGGLNSAGLYSYTPSTKTWAALGNLPGNVTRVWAFAFAYNGKGYLGGGAVNGGSVTNEFYEYDPTTNTWTAKAPFGGGVRDGGFAFVIGDKAYVGTGFDNALLHNDVWEYTFATNTWSPLSSFIGGPRIFSSSFVLNGKGYVVGGQGAAESDQLYEFDPQTRSWTERARFGGGPRQAGVAFALDGLGYYGVGMTGYSQTYQDMWTYNPSTDKWTELEHEYPTDRSAWSVAFVIGGKAYVGTGAIFSGQGVAVTDKFYSFPYEEPVPTASVSTNNIEFGEVTVGKTEVMVVRLSSLTNAELEVTNVEFNNPDALTKGFAISTDGPVPSTLPGLGTLLISLSFTPNTPELAETILRITTNDPANPTLEVQVSGTGVEQVLPGAVFSTDRLNFDEVKVGDSESLSFIISPANEAGLEVSSVSITTNQPALSVTTSKVLPAFLDQGEELEVTVTFTPQDTGSVATEVGVVTNSGGTGPTLVSITGHAFDDVSSVELSTVAENLFSIRVLPNPVKEQLQLALTLRHSVDATVRLVDITGATVLSIHEGNVVAGVRNFAANVSGLPAGSYFLESIVDGKRSVQPVVLHR